MPQFYVENSHPYIIEPEEFDAVQAELERRNGLGRPAGCGSPFSAKIVCGDCFGWYGSKVWGSSSKYRKTVWQCNDKYKGDHKCRTRHVTEAEVKERFLSVWNSLGENREALIADCQAAVDVLCDCASIDAEIAELHREFETVSELSRKALFAIAHKDTEKKALEARNKGYFKRLEAANKRIKALEADKHSRKSRSHVLKAFIRSISASLQVITEFDEKLWAASIDRVTVTLDDRLVFRFKDGREVEG